MTTLPSFVSTDWTRISTRDHSGDGIADILWHNDPTGANLLWTMSGTTVTATTELPTLPASYDTSVIGDFDGDGIADVLLRDSTSGGNRMLLSGGNFSPPAVLGNLPTAFKARAATDANGDGNDDIFWFNTNSAGITVYAMNGNAVTGVGSLASAYAVDDLLHAVFDGTALNTFDSLWFDTSSNSYNITSYDSGVRSITDTFSVESGNQFVNTDDYNGDGDPDFFFRDPLGSDTGDAEIVFSDGEDEIARLTYNVSTFDRTEITAGGDVDGDGVAELIARNRVSGETELLNAVGGTVSSQTIYGSDGADLIDGSNGNDRIFGQAGNDIILGGVDDDTIFGGLGNDRIDGGEEEDTLSGNAGDDVLQGGTGDDVLYGGAGVDTLRAGNGSDFLFGDSGDDYLIGGSSGWDHMRGGLGDDLLQSGSGNSLLEGEEGDDRLIGQNGDDYIFGGTGDDYMVGSFNNDTMFGGSGNDILIGPDLGGLSGVTDTLYGGSGSDYFYLGNDTGSYYTVGGNARIEDFSSSDYLVLNGLLGNYTVSQVASDVEIRLAGDLVADVINTTTATVNPNLIFIS